MFDVKIDMEEGFQLMECSGPHGTTFFSPGALKGYLSGEFKSRADGMKIYQGGEFGDGDQQSVVEMAGKYNVVKTSNTQWLLDSGLTPDDSDAFVEATPEEFRAFAEQYAAK